MTKTNIFRSGSNNNLSLYDETVSSYTPVSALRKLPYHPRKLRVLWVFFGLIRQMIWQKPCNTILGQYSIILYLTVIIGYDTPQSPKRTVEYSNFNIFGNLICYPFLTAVITKICFQIRKFSV